MPRLKKKTLITAALPYANASIHIGHMVEYVEADIAARFLRLIGKEVLFVCASDTHGTPIEVNAQKLGMKPEELVAKFNDEHRKDFKDFLVSFDDFYTTHSPENKELSELFFNTLNKKGYITKKPVDVMYCAKCDRSLPDRYVRGTCPSCGAADQYGDVCESCGMTHKGTDLIDSRCSICGSAPKRKQSEHYFFMLSKFADKLKKWIDENKNLQDEIKHHIYGWLDKGLEDWCISRDGPYFGFLIPGEKNKYFYVWMDAPIGYISTTKHAAKDWEKYWKHNSEILHFIGKDIIYFHFLFWPAMLMGAGFTLPSDIIVHGFLTVDGKKMSKSRGTFFTAREFLNLYPAEYLRFYYALHLSKKLADVDLDFKDFQSVVNNTLIGSIANFCYRVMSFAEKQYGGKVDTVEKDKTLIEEIEAHIEAVNKHYSEYNLKEALSEILAISTLGNTYFQNAAPWSDKENAKGKVGLMLNLARVLSVLIAPIMPEFSAGLQKQMGEKDLVWDDITFDKKLKVKDAKIIFTKVEKIPSTEQFILDLRVAKVVSVENHPNADSLYVLQIDLGKEKRQLVAGLKKYFAPDVLLGKHLVVCANLVPATIRGVKSEGMALAADDGKNVAVVEALKSRPGSAVTMGSYTNSTEPVQFEQFLKLGLKVANGKVVWNSAHLHTAEEDIAVKGVKEGAAVR